jgi:hypothetical protein
MLGKIENEEGEYMSVCGTVLGRWCVPTETGDYRPLKPVINHNLLPK